MADVERDRPAEVTGHSSGWSVNWQGLAGLGLIAALSLVAWQVLGGNSSAEDSNDAPVVSSSPPTTEPVVTTTATTTTTTEAPTPTTDAPTTTVTPERQVIINGEMKPCSYGANCLVASFSIEGFDPHPGRFVCIYPNSIRDFTFNNDRVEDACLTADAGDTITIEIDGVRSATISEQNLDGA